MILYCIQYLKKKKKFEKMKQKTRTQTIILSRAMYNLYNDNGRYCVTAKCYT
jgi:hypothetical protein